MLEAPPVSTLFPRGSLVAMATPAEPMKAKLTDRPFSDPAWVFERKLDGIRARSAARAAR